MRVMNQPLTGGAHSSFQRIIMYAELHASKHTSAIVQKLLSEWKISIQTNLPGIEWPKCSLISMRLNFLQKIYLIGIKWNQVYSYISDALTRSFFNCLSNIWHQKHSMWMIYAVRKLDISFSIWMRIQSIGREPIGQIYSINVFVDPFKIHTCGFACI